MAARQTLLGVSEKLRLSKTRAESQVVSSEGVVPSLEGLDGGISASEVSVATVGTSPM